MSIFTYSYDGNVLSELKQSWVDFYWERTYLRTYTYDNSGNMLTYLLQQWVAGHWNNFDYYHFSYTDDGKILSCLVQSWYNEEWLNSYLCTNYYDQYKRLYESLRQVWNNGTWVNAIRNLNTFNNEGLVLNSVTESWNGTKWVNVNRLSYSYDNNGNNLTYCEQFWGNDQWINSFLISRIFDIYANKLNEISMVWTNTWNNESNSTLTYNSENNCISIVSCLWNNNAWENSTRAEFLYTDGLIRGIGYVWQESGWTHGDAQLNLQIKEGNRNRIFCEWWGSLVDVHYPRLYTGTAEHENLSEKLFIAYPNPVKNDLHVQLNAGTSEQATITLYTISGLPVNVESYNQDQNNLKQITMNTSHLSPGMYILELRSGTSSSIQKILIAE
jgi:hypothetical protein